LLRETQAGEHIQAIIESPKSLAAKLDSAPVELLLIEETCRHSQTDCSPLVQERVGGDGSPTERQQRAATNAQETEALPEMRPRCEGAVDESKFVPDTLEGVVTLRQVIDEYLAALRQRVSSNSKDVEFCVSENGNGHWPQQAPAITELDKP
jgi:hypothetical protein